MTKLLITGGCGQCGTVLASLAAEKLFLDVRNPVTSLSGQTFIQGDVSDDLVLTSAMAGCDAVVHLAHTWPAGDLSDQQALDVNMNATNRLMEAAVAAGVERVIYASTNHVVGMLEQENSPDIYEDHGAWMLDRAAPVRPDSLYAVGKAFGENLGRYYAEHGGPRFYALRIGGLVGAHEDHPYAYAERGVATGEWRRGSAEYLLRVKRLKAIWLSRRDFLHLVECCLKCQGPAFDIFYGVSNNENRWLDIEHAKAVLGYAPKDDGARWTRCPQSVPSST